MDHAGLKHVGTNSEVLSSLYEFKCSGVMTQKVMHSIVVKAFAGKINNTFAVIRGYIAEYNAKHPGVFHVGTGSSMLYAVIPLRCIGSVMSVSTLSVKCIADITIKSVLRYIAEALLYAANSSTKYEVVGCETVKKAIVILCTAKKKSRAIIEYKVSSLSTRAKSKVFNVSAWLLGYGNAIYNCVSKLKSKGELRYIITSYMMCSSNVFCYVHGIVKKFSDAMYSVNSVITDAMYMYYKAKATISIPSFYVTKGIIKTLAFVASVPYKMQEFVTNKRWFKNG